MSDIVTARTFVDGEKGITATKLNDIIGSSVIQPAFYSAKPSSPTLDPTDVLLELKGTGAYAQITGSQLINSVGATLSVVVSFITKTTAYTLVPSDSNKYIICSGGSWTLTLPTPAAGLNFRVRNDMGISGTTGTITIQTAGGTIDGLVSMPLLPQQECVIITDSTNWRTFGLKREVILGTQDITSSTASGTVLLPAGYRYFELEFDGVTPVTNLDFLIGQFSLDGGATWTATGYYHGMLYNNTATTTSFSNIENSTSFYISAGASASAVLAEQSRLIIYPGDATRWATWIMDSGGRYTGPRQYKWNGYGTLGLGPIRINALKYFMASGNIASSFLTVKGVV